MPLRLTRQASRARIAPLRCGTRNPRQPTTDTPLAHYRLRYDRLDTRGKMTIRRAGRLHHLGVGAAHARTRVLAIADEHHVTVTDLATGEILSTHLIQPDKTHWRNQNKEPGRWPSSRTETYVATQV